MAEPIEDVIRWLREQLKGRHGRGFGVGIDDGGLRLCILNAEDKQTGSYYEIGGLPVDSDNYVKESNEP